MDALRGAMPAVECPRCGATSPPTEARLATCARCGLVFTPHEVQRPHRAPAVADPPPAITVTRTVDATIARWPLERGPGIAMALVALGGAAGSYEVTAYIGSLVFMVVMFFVTGLLAYLAAILLLDRVEVVIQRGCLIRRYRPVPLLDSRAIIRAGLTTVRFTFEPTGPQRPPRHCIEVGDGARWQLLAVTRRSDHARYLRDLIAQVCELVPR